VVKNRIALLIAGTAGGFASGAALIFLQLMNGGIAPLPAATNMAGFLGGGLLAGIVALGLVPLAEGVFEFLTDFRLVELSSPQNALQQRLVLDAPGTYQHSQVIANMVEQAVRQIGGNALLARVGALYHDVGKLQRPEFFAENQTSGGNPHDKLSPHLSYLIITSHVRDGIEMLRDHNLPPALEPFVAEHHGTTVLAYFYKRALEDAEQLDELNFRYPGPKPRSKETAVLMLADAVESTSRSLSDPTQGSIRAMIDRLFDQRLQDEQLSESPLNLRDLNVIAKVFERVMTASMHRRVQYPSEEEISRLKRGGDPGRDARGRRQTRLFAPDAPGRLRPLAHRPLPGPRHLPRPPQGRARARLL
jgi:putative nucleotidyltransferase with HDIG domain